MKVPQTYEEAVAILTQSHSVDDLAAGDLQIYFFPDPFRTTVRLLSVSKNYPDWDPTPFSIGRSHDFPFATSITSCTSEQWKEIVSGTRKLPIGWNSTEYRQVWPLN